jgi:hypothetical protein
VHHQLCLVLPLDLAVAEHDVELLMHHLRLVAFLD